MEQVRLILAVFLSAAILLTWQHFFGYRYNQDHSTLHQDSSDHKMSVSAVTKHRDILNRDTALEEDFRDGNRIEINNEHVTCSINLTGAKIDDLSLQQYANDIDSDAKVILLSPHNTQNAYFTEFGWLSNDKDLDVPTRNTKWHLLKKHSAREITLYWDNKDKIRFLIDIKLDDNYMFEITQRVENLSEEHLTLYPYTSIARSFAGTDTLGATMVHEGAIASLDNKLFEYTFSDLKDETVEKNQQNGWLGFSDKYWLVSLIPNHNERFNTKIFAQNGKYQADLLKSKISVAPGQTISDTMHIFAGAKKIDLLHRYQDLYKIQLFDRAVDFGILYFITKPIFMLLNYFYGVVGNFGIAILILTVFFKILLFPLAYKGFVNMNKLKALQPHLAQIKERHTDDTVAFQKALMALYKKETVNPMSGCLPLLLQMPIFFALYKVLSVTIEMRHAPFFGWLQDLSAQDPTSIFNLFGLLPLSLPSFLMIGVLPISMALTMHLQQKLNPAPTDPIQAKVMNFLPLVLLFVFSSFPSGLVLYWTWSNILSIIQQIVIKKMTS